MVKEPSYTKIKEGDRFGSLTFTGEIIQMKNGKRTRFICDCGNEAICLTHEVVSGKVSSCGCKSVSNGWKGKKLLWGDLYPFRIMLSRLIKHANIRNIDVYISEQDLSNLWEKQDGKCYYTKKPLILPKSFTDFDSNELCPSVDRINSKLPYTVDNIQIVLKVVNMMKLQMSHDEFILTCKQITEYTRLKNE